MPAVITITNVSENLNRFVIDGTITLTGNYGGASSHGDVLSFAGQDQIKSQQVPTFVYITEQPAAGTSATGDTFNFSPGSTQANGVMQVFVAGSEYTQGSAYSAGLLGAVLKFQAEFPSYL
jgi:hypothetical protein